MSWRSDVFLQLRSREWHRIGTLFEQVEKKIPLHYAMRRAMHPTRRLTELPTNSQARWLQFLNGLSDIKVETTGDPRHYKWGDEVRLRYRPGRECDKCHGPVIKASWSARSAVVCLACEARNARPVEPIPQPAPLPVSPPPIVEAPPAISESRAQRNWAKAIKSEFRLGLSVNEIVRQLQRWPPREIVNRYRHSLRSVRARSPPAATLVSANNP
jgi:hypothetical protein